MISKFRSLYNKIDRLFDPYAITQETNISRDFGMDKQPKTAKQALQMILPTVRKFDQKACLKSIVSQHGIDLHGTSAHWEFFFDLDRRKAKLTGEWALVWDDNADNYASSHIEVIVRPFPPADSPLRHMVQEGHLLYRQLAGMWKQERERRLDLPGRFRDTDVALADFSQQGLDVTLTEFSLSTGYSPDGRLCWIAQTRYKTYYVAFAQVPRFHR